MLGATLLVFCSRRKFAVSILSPLGAGSNLTSPSKLVPRHGFNPSCLRCWEQLVGIVMAVTEIMFNPLPFSAGSNVRLGKASPTVDLFQSSPSQVLGAIRAQLLSVPGIIPFQSSPVLGAGTTRLLAAFCFQRRFNPLLFRCWEHRYAPGIAAFTCFNPLPCLGAGSN